MSARNPIPPGVIYLDYAATSPLAPEVLDAMMPFLTSAFGNPGTLYSLGAESRQAIQRAREQVAELIGADDPNEIVFTSGGTEADNVAIRGVHEGAPIGSCIVCSAFEHHAVIDTCQAVGCANCAVVPVDEEGIVHPDALRSTMRDKPSLVSIMHANNEIGTIQPIEELAAVAHERGAVFHTDAVQSVGKIPVDVNKLGVDLLAIAGHKIYGPKGVGALYVRRGIKLVPTQTGGGQEFGRRGGTHNVAGIVGLGAAADLARTTMEEEDGRLRALQQKLIDGISSRIPNCRLTGSREKRVPHNIHFTFLGCEGESILLNLDLHGICCSAAAACSSGSHQVSHVLRAIGIAPDWGEGALRISLGRYTTESEIDRTLETLVDAVAQVRELDTVPQVTS